MTVITHARRKSRLAAMIDSGFLDPKQPKRLMQRLRRMFARTQLEKEEVNILRGILSALEKHRSA